MTTGLSKVDICNMALGLLNADGVTVVSIDTPRSKEETLCRRWYDPSRRALLRESVWNFARKRRTIARVATTPSFGYADAYQLPTDYVRLLYFGNDSEKTFKTKYQIEYNQVLLNNDGAASLKIGYIYDCVDVPKFDAGFIEAIAYKLAINISMSIGAPGRIRAALREDYEWLMRNAKSVDGQERPPIRIQNSRILKLRRRVARSSGIAGQYITFDE